MPFPQVPDETPPDWVTAQMGGWDPAQYRWDPYTQTVHSRMAGGGSWSMAGADPNMGSQLVTDLSAYNASGGQQGAIDLGGATPSFGFGDSAQGYNAGLMPGSGIFASTNPQEIADYQSHRGDVVNRGVATVGALVGGAAALGGALGGGGAASTAGATGATTAAGLPTGAGIAAAPLTAGTGAVGGGLLPGVAAGAGGLTGVTAGGTAAGAATNALTGGGAAAGAAGNALSNVPEWLTNYLVPGLQGLLDYRANDQASDAMAEAAQNSIAEQRRQYDTTRADLMPWMDAGKDALNQLNNPGQFFQASPDYGFRRDEGMRGIENSFAARGGAASGNAMKALTEFNSGLASGEYGNWWNRQAGRAGVGQTATTNLGSFGQNTAANVSNALTQQGDARASGYLGRANAINNTGDTALFNYLYRRRAA